MDKKIDGRVVIVWLVMIVCVATMSIMAYKGCTHECPAYTGNDTVFIPIKDDQAILELQRRIDSLESVKLETTMRHEETDPVDPDSAYLEFLRHVSRHRLREGVEKRPDHGGGNLP